MQLLPDTWVLGSQGGTLHLRNLGEGGSVLESMRRVADGNGILDPREDKAGARMKQRPWCAGTCTFSPTGYLGHGFTPLMLQMVFLTLFVGVLVAFLQQGQTGLGFGVHGLMLPLWQSGP
jgi:hypothetical protein